MSKASLQKIYLVLGDQLSTEHPFFNPALHSVDSLVLMVESAPRANWLPYHPQKLMYVFCCMRRFASQMKKKQPKLKFEYVKFSPLSITEVLNQYDAKEVHIVDPSEPRALNWLRTDLNAKVVVHENPFFLANDKMLPAKPPYLLETFYRAMRTRFSILLTEDGKPLGGQWNFDEDNRRAPKSEWQKKPPADYTERNWCDTEDVKIYEEVEKVLRAHLPSDRFGAFERPTLPTHREAALEFLDEFIEKRLELFGPYEDAMIAESVGLFHSALAPMMNLQILSPMEIIQAIVAAPASVPLASKEGFIRQVIGWREFVRLVYLRHRTDYENTNFFAFNEPLPPLYWGHSTRARCLSSVVKQVEKYAYSHHITRLMVLGNFALLTHTDPHEVNRWFWSVYLDAYEWVVTPNVLGMSQFADGGVFATKPYVSGANYINKMSLFCGGCAFNPKKTVGEDACPFNALYWDFVETTKRKQVKNAAFARRMSMMWSVWEKKSDEEKQAIREQAEKTRQAARSGKL